MMSNTKPKRDKPKGPPPPPMKPQNIEVEDYKLTAADAAQVFGVPPHLKAMVERNTKLSAKLQESNRDKIELIIKHAELFAKNWLSIYGNK